MPYYFNNMIRNYFICNDSEVGGHIYDLKESLHARSNLLFDFIDSTVYNFGPPSFNDNTQHTNKVAFQSWKQEIYAIVTNDIDLDDLSELEMHKCNMFWEAVYNHNLSDRYITFEKIESVFNQSPVTYQSHYIEILKTENIEQPYADTIDVESGNDFSDNELSDNDYLSESEQESISDAETVIVDAYTDEETDDETDDDETETDNIISDVGSSFEYIQSLEYIREITNNNPAFMVRIVQNLHAYIIETHTTRV